MLLGNFHHLLVSEEWGAGRSKRGICLGNDTLRLQILSKLMLRVIHVEFELFSFVSAPITRDKEDRYT